MLSNSSSQCPCRGCISSLPTGKLMCLTHWQMVPPHTQRCVYAAYQSLRKLKSQAAVQVYRDARQQAIDAVDRQGPLQ